MIQTIIRQVDMNYGYLVTYKNPAPDLKEKKWS